MIPCDKHTRSVCVVLIFGNLLQKFRVVAESMTQRFVRDAEWLKVRQRVAGAASPVPALINHRYWSRVTEL